MTDRISEVESWRDADRSFAVKRAGCTVARASLWWSDTPLLDGRRVGYFGDYVSDDWRGAECLLAAVDRDLRAAGCAALPLRDRARSAASVSTRARQSRGVSRTGAFDRAAFHALYAPLREQIDPDFIRIAEHDGRPVGFAFGIVDTSGCAHGAAPHTLVGKTQARLADRQYAGLGAVNAR